MNLSIPKTIKDVDSQWVLKLVQILEKVEQLSKVKIVQLNIEQELSNEGVLSDSCKVYLQVKIEGGLSPKKSALVHRWFVKTVPKQYQNVVIDNRLFEKEVTFYRQVFPLLQTYLKSKAVTLKHFKVPKFIFGDVNSKGEGVLVLEDLSSVGFDTFDPTLMLMDFERLTASIMALAEFHGLCMAFDRTFESKTLAQAFPIFETSHLMWMKDDMLHFLTRVSNAAAIFLKHFLNEEHWKKMALLLKQPKHIMDGEFARRKSSQWNCLQHGDSWHNNFLFRKIGKQMKVCVVDWQVAYHGHGPTDLCYLIYSSSTKFMRDKYLDYFLDLYYETLTELLEKLNIAFTPTFEEFHGEFIQSIPYCLLFCASADDFILDPDQVLPNVATDEEMRELEESQLSKAKLLSDTKMLKAIRRRNFLDICQETISYRLI